MQTNIDRSNVQGESGAVSKAGVGKLANLGVTIQRRWANVLSDAARQVVLECFLGLRLKEHFPSQALAYGNEEGVPLNESEDDLSEVEDSVVPPAVAAKVRQYFTSAGLSFAFCFWSSCQMLVEHRSMFFIGQESASSI